MALVHQRGWSANARTESPWYFPIRPLWDRVATHEHFPSADTLSELYAHEVSPRDDLSSQARALRFQLPEKRRRVRGASIELADLYEGQIVLRGAVPTRADDWHDFFNALTFCAFPAAKWALHARQFGLWQSRLPPGTQRLPGARTREQDALALFDEGGIALVLAPETAATLDPEELDLGRVALALWREGRARLVPFGHALYEHLVEGLACPFGTLHVVTLDFATREPRDLLRALDGALSHDLSDPTRFTAPSAARGLSLSAIADEAPLL